ncbi:MAG: zinc protease, partial [Verrucomicrobiota bacterium]
GGRSSRLYQQVRQRRGLVTSVDAWTYSPGNPGLFGMSAVVEPGKFEAARDAMLAELEAMKSKPVPKSELNKAVKQFIAGTLASRKTMQGQAQDLGGSWMSAGDLNFSERYLEAVKKLAPADLQRVARHYLTPENRTSYVLLPNGTIPRQSHTLVQHADNLVQKFELPNGLRLLVKEDHRLPFVEFRAVFKGGVIAETTANNGITALLARMLLQGTRTRSGEQIVSEIESVGGHIDTYGGNNSLGVNAEVMSSDFVLGLDLLSDVILHPAFPAKALALEKEIQISNIRSQRDELLMSASKLMRRDLFGNAGYGLHASGTEASVSALQRDAFQRFHAALAIPNNCVLAIYGDIQAAAVRAAVQKKFGAWKSGPPALAAVVAPPLPSKPKRTIETRDKKQAVMLLGFPGTTLDSPDRFALELIQESCSDLGSRLFLRIREKLGLAYYVGAQNFLGLVPGYFAFYVGTAPEKIDLVETELRKEAESLCSHGLTAEELKRAKAKIVGQKKIARQDIGSYAATTALDELYGLGWRHTDTEDAHYEAVTLADTREIARKYLRPEALVIAIIKPE